MNTKEIALETIMPKWSNATCIIAATGPSLSHHVAEQCRGYRTIAVNDAYILFPWADILYACDKEWWRLHDGVPSFTGEKWSSHEDRPENDKIEVAQKYNLKLVAGKAEVGFSFNPKRIHYGNTSSFQAINLAILLGATKILLVGFDMRNTQPRHFFGDHPPGLKNGANFSYFIPAFMQAAETLPEHIKIINCTPNSALKCFPVMELSEALCC